MRRQPEAPEPVEASRPRGGAYASAPNGSADRSLEAARWLEREFGTGALPPLLIVIGLDEGHLLDALDRRAPGTRVLAIEPDAAAADAFLARQDLLGWRAGGRLKYLAAPDYGGAEDAWRIFPPAHDAFRLLTHPRLSVGPQAVEAARLARKIVFGVRANAEARRKFAPRYLRNVVRNMPAIARGHDVRALAGRYSNVPALITAAGPSLDNAIDQLRSSQSRALFIATDTTLRPLAGAGITPHLVVGADPGEANARHFRELPACSPTWLVAESALDASAAAAFAGRTFWFRVSNHHPWPWLRDLGVDIGQLEMWGSVLTAAFQVACLAGCNPIVIVGADLSFTGGRPYCRGTTYEFDWAYRAATGVSLAQSWHDQMSRSQLRTVPDLNGRDTTTTGALMSFRDWMLAHARRSGRRVINATGGGILYGDGVLQLPLADALSADVSVGAVDPPSTGTPWGGGADLARALRDVERRLSSDEGAGTPLAEWRQFSGDGFDAASLGAAARTAADDLESHRRTAAAPIIPWSELERRVAGSLTRLPESTRLDIDGAGTGNRSALDSLRILDRICHAVCGLDTIVADASAPSESRAMVVRYAWPESVRWALHLVDALLGATLNAREPVADSDTSHPIAAPQSPVAALPSIPVVACLELLDAWTCRVAERGGTDAGAVRLLRSGLRAIEAEVVGSGVTGTEGPRLIVSADAEAHRETLRLPLTIDQASVSRLLTGALASDDRPIEIGRFTSAGLTVAVRIAPSSRHERLEPAAIVPPRHLLSGRSQRAIVSYATSRGVVCVTPYALESVLVTSDGCIEPFLEWPRPIVGELPFGDGGAVAWDNGLTEGAAVRPGCVMYRRTPDAPVTAQEISVRPTIGAWWQGRLYLNCFPAPDDSWVGLASWAPGEDIRFEVPDVVLFGLLPEESGLRLEPCCFVPNVGYERQLAATGTMLTASGTIETRLDAFGQTSCRADGRTWMALVHPVRDLVRLIAPSGETHELRCEGALRAAWINGSLLVSTIDRRLLFFSDLERALAPASAP
jgi:hypothetical protein